MSHLSFARQMSSLKAHKNTHLHNMNASKAVDLSRALVVLATDVPGDEERGVVVRGMAVVLDVLALLPDAEVVKSRGSVEAHIRSFLLITRHHVYNCLNVEKKTTSACLTLCHDYKAAC